MLLQQTDPVPPDSTAAYIIMQFCFSVACNAMHNFVSGPLFQFAALQQAYKTALLDARRRRQPLPRPGRQRARLRRRRRRRQRPRPGEKRARPRRRPLPRPPAPASPLCTSTLPRPPAVPAGGAPRGHVPRLVCVADVDLFVAAAVPAGVARRGHVCVGIAGIEILQLRSFRKHIK